MKTRRVYLLTIIAAVLFMLVTGCASGPKHEALDAAMRAGNCLGAGDMVDAMKDKYGKNQELLFHMDSSLINLYCGEHSKGRKHLADAELIVDELWTKSITRQGASFLLNDYTIPYAGEDFEKVMVNLFSAMSYALEGDYEPSLVEVRKVNSLLLDMNQQYEKKSVYREDAFARYLSALLYEADNPRDMQNLDSAAIDYERGLEVYESYGSEYGTPVPDVFMQDYWRVTEATGRLDDARELRKEHQWLSHKEARKMGRVVMLHLSGRVPVKEEEAIVAAAPYGPIKVAFPKYERPVDGCSQSLLTVALSKDGGNGGDSLSAKGELVEDLSSIAVKSLDDRKGRVIAKAIARAIVKQAAVEAAVREAGSAMDKALVRIAGRVAAAATENADLRSWRTLPGKIYMTRLFVPEGTYNIDASYCGMSAQLGRDVNIKAGQTKFVLLQNVY